VAKLCFKVVVFSYEDLDWAENLHEMHPKVPLYLSAGSPIPAPDDTLAATRKSVIASLTWLSEAVLLRSMMRDCIVLPQMHTLIWGREKGK
jgi:7-carboxy-7-deazaguanine synthase